MGRSLTNATLFRVLSSGWSTGNTSCSRAMRGGHESVCAFSARRRQLSSKPIGENGFFLQQVHDTVDRVLQAYGKGLPVSSISSLGDRESLVVARRLQAVLEQFERDGCCPRCWLKPSFCICNNCPPLEGARSPIHPKVNRIFLLMHHQEVGLSVDTAKMILAAFPESCRLVVGGIGPEFQPSMKEMLEAMGVEVDNVSSSVRMQYQSEGYTRKCLALFPTSESKTFDEWAGSTGKLSECDVNRNTTETGWDLIVIDGTWSQARRLHGRYIPNLAQGGPRRVRLRTRDLDQLMMSDSEGRQLRKHPIQWRQIGTLEALRLLLRDMLQDSNVIYNVEAGDNAPAVWETLTSFQTIANEAAKQMKGRSS